MVKSLLTFCFLISIITGAFGQSYNTELAKYVNSEGWVDYKSWKSNDAGLRAYLQSATQIDPTRLTDNERKAFYINIYNAVTVSVILENYPLKSITDLDKPWDVKRIELKTKGNLSLNDIENNILRKEWSDPRIHFAINCASYSCPKLWNRLFEGKILDTQLNEATNEFLKDPLRNNLDSSKWIVSKVFDWFAVDFKSTVGVEEFIMKHSSAPKPIKIDYLDYNWALNSQN